jgi:hypothetical protein
MQKLSPCQQVALAGNLIASESYQKVIIIVMPMIPLANVAHLLTLAMSSLYHYEQRQHLQHRFRQGDRSIFELL